MLSVACPLSSRVRHRRIVFLFDWRYLCDFHILFLSLYFVLVHNTLCTSVGSLLIICINFVFLFLFIFSLMFFFFFFFNNTATPEIYPLPLPDALPILKPGTSSSSSPVAKLRLVGVTTVPPVVPFAYGTLTCSPSLRRPARFGRRVMSASADNPPAAAIAP